MQKRVCGLVFGAMFAFTMSVGLAQSTDSDTPPPPANGMRGHGPMDPAKQAAHLARRLSLTAEQEAQVASLLTSQEAERKSLEQNQSITHQQFMAQTKAIHEQTKTKIEALLTETQKQEFAQVEAHMRHGPPPAGPEGDAPPQQ
jgi:protein CpxP